MQFLFPIALPPTRFSILSQPLMGHALACIESAAARHVGYWQCKPTAAAAASSNSILHPERFNIGLVFSLAFSNNDLSFTCLSIDFRLFAFLPQSANIECLVIVIPHYFSVN